MNRFFIAIIFLTFGACKPTYKKETLKESVKALAQKEYSLDVDVQQVGKTLGLSFKINDLVTELYSGDPAIYKKINGLFTILARVVLSSDQAPDFMVLDIVDANNPHFRLMFTRYEEDLRKSMAEALSYSQTQDRMLEEFVISGKRIPFDPQEMDLVQLMMMAMDTNEDLSPKTGKKFQLEEVHFHDFVVHVAENTLRRLLREKKDVNRNSVVREVKASFESTRERKGALTVWLDMASKSTENPPPLFIEKIVLPFAAKELTALFKSYRFNDFSGIKIIEKNSGKILTVP